MQATLPFFMLLLAMASPGHADMERRHLSTSGSGQIEATPDMARLQLHSEAQHLKSSDAKDDVDQRVNQLLDKLKKLGVKRDDVIASSIQINPNYEYRNQQRQFAGYRATRTLSVTVRNLDKLSSIMDSALQAGVQNISQVELASSRDEQHKLTAQQAAIEDSKTKAAKLAAAYGAELGAIYSINYFNSDISYPQIQADIMAETTLQPKAMRSAPPAQYLHDKIVYRDQIHVVFDLIIHE